MVYKLEYIVAVTLTLLLAAVAGSCGSRDAARLDPRIAVIGSGERPLTSSLALRNMGQVCDTLPVTELERLRNYPVAILGRDAMAGLDTASVAAGFAALTEYAREGGVLIVFGLRSAFWRDGYLPAEIKFAMEDPSGWGNYDFSEEIAAPEHQLFNFPHKLDYLAGLQEPDRIVSTGAGWRILLAKDSLHPSFAAFAAETVNDVGSIFEIECGAGRIVVCQPILELYYAGGAASVPHPLEGGILLFENLIAYARTLAAGERLPVIGPRPLPGLCVPGDTVRFEMEAPDEWSAYEWDFGDGRQSDGRKPVHVYRNPGEYLVRLKAVGPGGRVARAACRVEAAPAREKRWGEYLAESLLFRYYRDPMRLRPNYRTALFLDGVLDVCERTGNPELIKFVDGFFRSRLIERWDTRPYRGDYRTDVDFVDIYSLMSPAWRMFGLTGDSDYPMMCREVWEQSLTVSRSLPPDALWGPWNWQGREAIVDFAYFKTELRADYYRAGGDKSVLDEAARQMLMFDRTFRDPSDNLYFQAICLDGKAHFYSPERPSGLNDSKWGRANGWMALAWAELMEVLPESHPRRAETERAIRRFFGGVVASQDPDTGLWALITDRVDHPGMWMETTSSGMFVYAMVRLLELGVLPSTPFLDSARRGYNGLQQRIRLGAQGFPYLSDGCEGTLPRVNIERWLAAHRHDNDFHAVGPYLRAEEAVWRVAPPEVAVIGGTGREIVNSLEISLNRDGRYFYRIPELGSTPDLERFGSVYVAAGAFDRDEAGIRTLFPRLVSYARSGGRLVLCRQQRLDELLAALPPGLDPRGDNPVPTGGWVSSSNGDARSFRLGYGEGEIIYLDEDTFPGQRQL